MLSGDAQGQPEWVRELGEPGDAGWFGPDSVAWQVHGSLATLVGGIRALLMQACHPLALAGVVQHSNYREDPLDRLQRTNRFLTGTIFGSTVQAEGAVARVRDVHVMVNGQAEDGRQYSAGDPHLLLWVHLGLVDSMLVAAQTFSGLPVDADRYVQEMAVIGEAVGVTDAPRTAAQLADALQEFRSELTPSPAAASVARFLQFPGRSVPYGAWGPYVVLSRAAVDLLPAWAASIIDAPQRHDSVKNVDAVLCRCLFAMLRQVLGRHSPAALLSYQRVGCAAP
jgi:uncharacterized protein (DUF2236 family)